MASMSLAGVLASFMGPALVMTVEVPQIQFLDGGMVGISGLGAWFDSGYMVYVSPWVLLNRLPCSPCTWKLDAPL